ncbi:MAG: Fe-Mn family superoxide dismutase [Candidatus Parcubacteria bacterium]|nr:Fe-Mn family superoxide dismutase [Candidatus Parcubacteria bacterium]
MKNYSEEKKLSFSKLKGISEKSISIHHDKLYGGYVKKWQEIQERLKQTDKSSANATFSDLRSLKIEETFSANAILLHEAYFDALGGEGKPEGEIVKALENDFGTFENWQEEFKAIGMAARGWVVLAYDFNDGKLRNYLCDLHNQGGIWGTSPLLVMDVYEHAYFIDYGSDRKSYIEDFFANLNWQVVEKRFQRVRKQEK